MTSPPTRAREASDHIAVDRRGFPVDRGARADAQRSVDGVRRADMRVIFEHHVAIDCPGHVGAGAAFQAHIAVHGGERAVGLAGFAFDRSVHGSDVVPVAAVGGRTGRQDETARQETRTALSAVSFMRDPLCALGRAVRERVASGCEKKKPRTWRGSLVACLLVCGGVLSLFLFLSDAVFVEPLAKEGASPVPEDSDALPAGMARAGPRSGKIASLRNMSRRKRLASCQNPDTGWAGHAT